MDITADIDTVRKMVPESPDIEVDEFYNILQLNALLPFIAHTKATAYHQRHVCRNTAPSVFCVMAIKS
jgi:hypothetical protein